MKITDIPAYSLSLTIDESLQLPQRVVTELEGVAYSSIFINRIIIA